jgi:hypothetical protein
VTLFLDKLSDTQPIVTSDRYPTRQFQYLLQRAFENIETSVNSLEDFVTAIVNLNDLITTANEAIEAVNTVAETITAASALSTSFVENFTPPVVEADSAGLVTIANHDRHYGDGTIVAVTGDTLATGEASPTRVHIYYSDPSRAGGAVTYQYSTDEADAAQIGDVHNVGAVEIPAAGTQSGGYARPPGYGGFEP